MNVRDEAAEDRDVGCTDDQLVDTVDVSDESRNQDRGQRVVEA
jgi:hypothetical protein